MSIVENFMQCSHTNQESRQISTSNWLQLCFITISNYLSKKKLCVSPKYSVWPKLSQIPKLAKSETTQTSLPFPIISRQFRAFVDKKSTPFPILNSRELALLSLILLFWPSQPEELDKKTRVFYCCLQWVGGGRRRERKKER